MSINTRTKTIYLSHVANTPDTFRREGKRGGKDASPSSFVPQFGKGGIITFASSAAADNDCASANTRADQNPFHASETF
jgi:hypothetical protein